MSAQATEADTLRRQAGNGAILEGEAAGPAYGSMGTPRPEERGDERAAQRQATGDQVVLNGVGPRETSVDRGASRDGMARSSEGPSEIHTGIQQVETRRLETMAMATTPGSSGFASVESATPQRAMHAPFEGQLHWAARIEQFTWNTRLSKQRDNLLEGGWRG